MVPLDGIMSHGGFLPPSHTSGSRDGNIGLSVGQPGHQTGIFLATIAMKLHLILKVLEPNPW